MAQTVVSDLERVAQHDPSVAPLARLQAVALAAAESPSWASGVPSLHFNEHGAPLLEGQRLQVAGNQQRSLFTDLARSLAEGGSEDGRQLHERARKGRLDALTLLAASVVQDGPQLADLASTCEVGEGVLRVVGHVSALPLLLACGAQAGPTLDTLSWPHGSCPVCGAYPTLAELRGLARDRVLRCGRCAAGWSYPHDRCPFCEDDDQRAQGYLAAERERESRRAVTCESCLGYLKTVATLGPLTPSQVLLRDLDSLELDIAALEAGYARPDRLGWQLTVQIEAASSSQTGARRRWWSR